MFVHEPKNEGTKYPKSETHTFSPEKYPKFPKCLAGNLWWKKSIPQNHPLKKNTSPSHFFHQPLCG